MYLQGDVLPLTTKNPYEQLDIDMSRITNGNTLVYIAVSYFYNTFTDYSCDVIPFTTVLMYSILIVRVLTGKHHNHVRTQTNMTLFDCSYVNQRWQQWGFYVEASKKESLLVAAKRCTLNVLLLVKHIKNTVRNHRDIRDSVR